MTASLSGLHKHIRHVGAARCPVQDVQTRKEGIGFSNFKPSYTDRFVRSAFKV